MKLNDSQKLFKLKNFNKNIFFDFIPSPGFPGELSN